MERYDRNCSHGTERPRTLNVDRDAIINATSEIASVLTRLPKQDRALVIGRAMAAAETAAPTMSTAARRPLTARQAECLAFIVAYQARNRRPPTLREIGRAMGIRSTNGVHDHLLAMERKGYITYAHDASSRSVHVVDEVA